jgi:hypothetical protein
MLPTGHAAGEAGWRQDRQAGPPRAKHHRDQFRNAFYYAEADLHEFHLMMFEVLIVKSASWPTFDSL